MFRTLRNRAMSRSMVERIKPWLLKNGENANEVGLGGGEKGSRGRKECFTSGKGPGQLWKNHFK